MSTIHAKIRDFFPAYLDQLIHLIGEVRQVVTYLLLLDTTAPRCTGLSSPDSYSLSRTEDQFAIFSRTEDQFAYT